MSNFRFFITLGLLTFFGCNQKTGVKVKETEIIKTFESPVFHEKGFKAEKELFGYDPTVSPNVVSFNKKNSPVFKRGLDVWTLDKKDKFWQKENLSNVLKKKYPRWNGNYKYIPNYQLDDRVVFDEAGAAYCQIYCGGIKGIDRTVIFYKPTGNREWQCYSLPAPYQFAKLESTDGHNNRKNPPSIMLSGYYIDKIAVLLPKKNADGTLNLGDPILITESALNPGGGWSGNQIISSGNFIYATWASKNETKGQGTATYIKKFDKKKQEWSKAKFLGNAGTNKVPNVHNIPSLTIDSEGYLHIVLGAHHEYFNYRKSSLPHSISKWTSPIVIGKEEPAITDKLNYCRSNCGYYTYPSLICDKSDNIHLVSRWAGDTAGYTYFFRLVYHHKTASASTWSPRETVVVPFRAYYSNWYQKLSLDNKGNVFLFYSYYADQLFPEEIDAYKKKFPKHEIVLNPNIEQPKKATPNSRSYNYYKNIQANSPTWLQLNKSKKTWQVVTSKEFK